MAGYIENISLPILPISDAEASILDFFVPGFSRISTVVQWYLRVDLSLYAPLLCYFGLFVFICGRICMYLWALLETYCSKNPFYLNKRTHFLTISSFNCSFAIS